MQINVIYKIKNTGCRMEVSEKYKLINKELEIENKVLMENLQKQLKDY